MSDAQLKCLNFIQKCGNSPQKIKGLYYKKYKIKNYLTTLHQLKTDGHIEIEFGVSSDGDFSLQEPYLDKPIFLRQSGIELKEKIENKSQETRKNSINFIMTVLLVICTVLQTIKMIM